MKRDRHILINITETQYNTLMMLSDEQKRKVSEYAYLLLIQAINDEISKNVSIYNGDFKPLTWK